MKNKLTATGRKFALQQNIFIIGFISLSTIVTYFIWGWMTAKSVMMGGTVVIGPNMLFAYKAFKYAGAQSSRKVVDSFFSGVKLKMALMAILLALAFKFLVFMPMPFFAMFSLVLLLPTITAYLFEN
jgi:ATP synthase protein I